MWYNDYNEGVAPQQLILMLSITNQTHFIPRGLLKWLYTYIGLQQIVIVSQIDVNLLAFESIFSSHYDT